MSRKFALLFFLPLVPVLAVASRTAWPGQDYYMDPSQVDLIHILAPPLSPDSTKAKQTCKPYWRRFKTRRQGHMPPLRRHTNDHVLAISGVSHRPAASVSTSAAATTALAIAICKATRYRQRCD
jgi:hypothetical protein